MSQTVELTMKSFKPEVLDSDVPVVIDFWAPWCGPCRTLSPMLEAAAERYAGKLKVAKVNVDEERTLATTFKVSSIPMLLYIKGGQVVDQSVGVPSRSDLDQRLLKLIG